VFALDNRPHFPSIKEKRTKAAVFFRELQDNPNHPWNSDFESSIVDVILGSKMSIPWANKLIKQVANFPRMTLRNYDDLKARLKLVPYEVISLKIIIEKFFNFN
jgi:hypothetical protein